MPHAANRVPLRERVVTYRAADRQVRYAAWTQCNLVKLASLGSSRALAISGDDAVAVG